MKDRFQQAVNEGRILVLVAQVLLSFEFQAVFQRGFEKLPAESQALKLASLGLQLAAIALLVTPAAYHRTVEQGNLSVRLIAVTSRLTMIALIPLAMGLGLDLYVAAERMLGKGIAIAAAVGGFVFATAMWFGIVLVVPGPEKKEERAMETERPPLKDRVDNVLTEARVVLPGSQAMLAFQFAVVLTEGFERAPAPLRIAHFVSLALVAVSCVLLMSPAAWHRIVERGDDTERLHTYASWMVLLAMAFLSLGIAGDMYVAFAKVLRSTGAGLIAGTSAAAVFYGFWFVFPAVARRLLGAPERSRPAEEPMRSAIGRT